jgi:AcrR family transcriptional regulator
MSEAPRSEGSRGAGYAKGRARRDDILEAANAAFSAQGYRGASLATIAESAGLSQPGLLHHFPSKEELLLEVLRLRHERDVDRIEEVLAEKGSYLDALAELCRENASSPGLVRLFTVLAAEAVDTDHPGHTPFLERYRELRRRVSSRLAAEQQEGRIAPRVDVDLLAPQIIALFDGLQLQWLMDPDEIDMAAVLEDFLARLGA